MRSPMEPLRIRSLSRCAGRGWDIGLRVCPPSEMPMMTTTLVSVWLTMVKIPVVPALDTRDASRC
jgi:hypothetical protein